LLETCVRHGVGKVVFASTGGAIYGEQHESPASEDRPLYPVSPYGVSKPAGERSLNYYRVQYGLPHMALRYSNVYGPRQDPHGEAGVVAIFGSNLAAGRISTINGTGEQTRDYVYVEDAARASVLALEDAGPSGAYNIGHQLRDQRQPTLRVVFEDLRQRPSSEARAAQAGRAAA
jgi:UDP-glucose 4-epimerase